jgi:hypothetical protein
MIQIQLHEPVSYDLIPIVNSRMNGQESSSPPPNEPDDGSAIPPRRITPANDSARYGHPNSDSLTLSESRQEGGE